ncbi:RNA polymerase sigma-70 factor, ECF subfamily [Pseudomonas flavescens]|uniref:RNA polymerase sigma-70 factor, ECF subfamily n=1 Tax=Phytopseudomonas flavescens TaxID=29435 RepID=A0A1G8FY72_9GAMM|nr:sigma-70 family RNA polymerase sigma factor [Pseudomonas flavescens]SDH87073.1 RNA polymerase sigma-70 factor, ECF subfamily [Pseudomonas flavescens]
MNDSAEKLDIFLSCRRALVNYAAQITRDRDRAEDVVQEAYLRLHPLQRPELQAIEQPVAYLYRIVRNLALDMRLSEAREQRRHAMPPDWLLPTLVAGPEEACLHSDELEQLSSALADLPEQSRRALEMHRLGGKTLAQIAEQLGVSLATAHRLVRDALVRLARALPADGPREQQCD